MFDVAIVGAGPAGLSAALCLQVRGKRVLWFGSPFLSTKLGKAERILNYPGVPSVSGEQLNACFSAQLGQMGLELTDQMVSLISKTKTGFQLLADNELYEAKTVLLAVGAVPSKSLPGEERLLGRGVSHCATCDGFLYRQKTLAVYCEEPRFESEVSFLAGLAKQVYLFCPYTGVGIDLPQVSLLQSPLREITGESRADGVVLADGSRIQVDGVFLLRSAVAPATMLPGLVTDGAHIVVDRACRTNIPGCFAAGDCTGRPYQIAKAVGEGNVAAHGILDVLSESEKGA